MISTTVSPGFGVDVGAPQISRKRARTSAVPTGW